MELRDATALLLGGTGLVGMAVARRFLEFGLQRIIVTGLTRDEVDRSTRELVARATGVQIEGAGGNIFLPSDVAQNPRDDLLGGDETRRRLV